MTVMLQAGEDRMSNYNRHDSFVISNSQCSLTSEYNFISFTKNIFDVMKQSSSAEILHERIHLT
jgi:hypothetical protein